MLKLIRKMIMKKGDSEILKELLKHHNDVNSSSTASIEVSKNKSYIQYSWKSHRYYFKCLNFRM